MSALPASLSALSISAPATATAPVLQSLPLAFVGSVGALAGSTGVVALAFYRYGRRLRGSDDRKRALARLRRAFRLGLPAGLPSSTPSRSSSVWGRPPSPSSAGTWARSRQCGTFGTSISRRGRSL